MDNKKLADLLDPDAKDVEFWFKKYPKRNLPDGAEVTRLAPSPTGFVHFGALFASLCNCLVAKRTGGVFYLRIEDTDKKREVEGGTMGIIIQRYPSFKTSRKYSNLNNCGSRCGKCVYLCGSL